MAEPVEAASLFARATETAEFLRKSLPNELQYPKVAIVCGSGLGGLANTVNAEPRVERPYAEVPHFAVSTGEHGS